jgi:hypothetical protein
VTYERRSTNPKWTIAWHGPAGIAEATATNYGDVMGWLSRAGADGWEIISVDSTDDGSRRAYWDVVPIPAHDQARGTIKTGD